MINAGKYKHRIDIYSVSYGTDAAGFKTETLTLVLSPHAEVKTAKGMTLIMNNTDFEKAYTNFTIRYPVTPVNRDMIIMFRGKRYSIEYLNNVNEANVELEMQCKEVTH